MSQNFRGAISWAINSASGRRLDGYSLDHALIKSLLMETHWWTIEWDYPHSPAPLVLISSPSLLHLNGLRSRASTNQEREQLSWPTCAPRPSTETGWELCALAHSTSAEHKRNGLMWETVNCGWLVVKRWLSMSVAARWLKDGDWSGRKWRRSLSYTSRSLALLGFQCIFLHCC